MNADHEIVMEVKNGNVAAFEELVTRHQQVLLRLAIRMTRDLGMAEDIVQDSFVKAFSKIHMFEGRSSFKSWIYQITLNTAKNKLRKRRYDCVDIDKVNLAVEAEVENGLMHKDIKDIIKFEVDKLPMKQKTALSLRIYEDLSFKEIAEIMDCPYDTAKANYRHGLMKLRHRFEESMALNSWKNYETTLISSLRGRVAEVDA